MNSKAGQKERKPFGRTQGHPQDEERSPASQTKSRQAMIRLMNGDALHGSIVSFSPDNTDIQLREKNQTVGKARTLAANEVAYVAFTRVSTSPASASRLSGMKPMRIHTETGETFDSHVLNLSLHASGFYAFMTDQESRFEYVYFFHHGVRTHEDKRPLGEILVAENLVSEQELQRGLEAQSKQRNADSGRAPAEHKAGKQQKPAQPPQRGKRLGEILLDTGAVSEKDLLLALAAKFHIPIMDLDKHPVDPDAIYEVDASLIRKYQWLPVARDEGSLTTALSDPLDMNAYDAFRFYTNKRIREVLVSPSQIQHHIENMLDTSVENESEKLTIEMNTQKGEAETSRDSNEIELMKNAGAPPVVQLVNKIIMGGLRKGASDIHLLPQEKNVILAYRINGDLLQETQIKKEIQQRVISRIKIISGMDISDRRMPQDGRMVVRYKGRPVEFRISSIPNIYGESIVMRILNKETNMDIETLGLRHDDCNRLARVIRKPHGLILATGPTGSGKSTTLFTLVKSLVDSPAHIVTIEDPVESKIPGVNQIQVNPKIGLDFARILRNILRHDPDIIMLGEIRDHDTAEIAMRAALTGHLLLSTLHTNTAVDTVVRLMDMGIPAYLLAQGLLAVISQSLIKRLCPSCR